MLNIPDPFAQQRWESDTGMSVINIMIGAGLLAFITTGIVTMTKQASRANTSINAAAEREMLRDKVWQQAYCNNIMPCPPNQPVCSAQASP